METTGEYFDLSGDGELVARGHELTVRDKNFHVVYEGSFGSYASAANYFYECYGKGYSYTIR